ncbi:hypothetical protein, partial [Aggregatibacter actinomycetemcomitans]|uniref:hypothetical protein n=1 Tax=Aggregatibacter actinomycetemcomitans TaxID=714 RepID=UPI00197C8414
IREAAQHFILPPILLLSSGCNALKNKVSMDFTVNIFNLGLVIRPTFGEQINDTNPKVWRLCVAKAIIS